jgi:hypothetical protein
MNVYRHPGSVSMDGLADAAGASAAETMDARIALWT